MDEHIATQGDRGVVIDAARSVCDITHDDGQCISEPIRGFEQIEMRNGSANNPVITCAPLDDICDGTCKHLETLRHLKSNHVGSILANMMYRLVDFKRVVGGQLLDCLVKERICEDFFWNLVRELSWCRTAF